MNPEPGGAVKTPALGPGEHHLCLAFREDGQVDFYPATADPPELARRLTDLLHVLIEHPSAVRCAVGDHGSACLSLIAKASCCSTASEVARSRRSR